MIDPGTAAHLAALSPEAHTAFSQPPGGPILVYRRNPDGSWADGAPWEPEPEKKPEP
jgi:hypothetical protein